MSKSMARILGLALLLLLVFSLPASAAAPDVNYGTATVDGNPAEWQTSPLDNTNPDWFANLHQAGQAQQPVVGDVFLRYDCATETMYILALHRTAGEVQTDQGNAETFVRVDGAATGENDFPAFAWVNQSGNRADGWEASFPLSKPPANNVPENHTFNVHYLFDDGDETGQTSTFVDRELELTLVCSPTAVSLASFGPASAGLNSPLLAWLGLAAILAVGLARAARRRA